MNQSLDPIPGRPGMVGFKRYHRRHKIMETQPTQEPEHHPNPEPLVPVFDGWSHAGQLQDIAYHNRSRQLLEQLRLITELNPCAGAIQDEANRKIERLANQRNILTPLPPQTGQ